MNDITKSLKEIVGPEWVSDDPEILISYGRDIGSLSATVGGFIPQREPDYVVLPENTEQVQEIVKIANRYKVPVIPATTGANTASMNIPVVGGIRIDFKRMNKIIEIDEENMSARIQPCVTFEMLQSEAHRRGLQTFITAAPSTGTPIGNSLFAGVSRVQHQIGMAFQQIIDVEMVLSDGTVLRTGSSADNVQSGGFWWHGPGPDLTYLPLWVSGGYGIVTEMTWKLHPRGEVRRTVHVFYDKKERVIAAHNELAKREIPRGLCIAPSPYYGQRYADGYESIDRCVRAWPPYVLALCLEGTRRQVEYEEKICQDIVERTGGRNIDTLPKAITERYFFTEDGATRGDYCRGTTCAWAVGSTRQSGFFGIVAPSEILEFHEVFMSAIDRADPEYAKGRGRFWRPIYVYTANWGHFSVVELVSFSRVNPATIEQFSEHIKRAGAAAKECFDKGGYGFWIVMRDSSGAISSRLGTYFEIARRIKQMVDPNNIMNRGIGFPKDL